MSQKSRQLLGVGDSEGRRRQVQNVQRRGGAGADAQPVPLESHRVLELQPVLLRDLRSVQLGIHAVCERMPRVSVKLHHLLSRSVHCVYGRQHSPDSEVLRHHRQLQDLELV